MKLKDVNDRSVINCKTQKEFEAIISLLQKEGFTWCSKEQYNYEKDLSYFTTYGSDFCMNITEGRVSPLSYYLNLNYKILPASLFLEFVVPEKFCVKQPKVGLELSKYANNLYERHVTFETGCYFHFPEISKGICTAGEPSYGYKEISYDQFLKYVLKQETMKTQKVTREQIRAIHDVACGGWKIKLEAIVKEFNIFSDSHELGEDKITEMYQAADKSQIKVLNTIFTRPENDKNPFRQVGTHSTEVQEFENISRKLFNDKALVQIATAGVPSNKSHLRGRALWVDCDYQVVLHTNEANDTIIELVKR